MNPILGYLIAGGVLLVYLLIVAVGLVWLERKFAARIQSRIGPYWVGRPHGWLQLVADGIKLLIKEDITPDKADKTVYNLAPIVFVTTTLLVFAAIPWSQTLTLADLNVGVLYLVAIASLGLVGIFMAAWGSNNKYALISTMRAAAMLISYEIPLVLSLLIPVILAGSMRIHDIVAAQNVPFVLYPVVGQLAFLLFLLSSLAEGNRAPFDVPEAESELVAGFTIEYTGLKFAFFMLSEYAHLFAVSAIGAALFLAGWRGPWLPPALWMFLKTMFLFLVILWIRWSYIRLRVDQVLKLNWKYLVPLSLVNLALAGLWVIWRAGGGA